MFDPKPVHIDTMELRKLAHAFFAHLKRRKTHLFVVVLFFLSVAATWALVRKPQYKAVATFVLEEKSSGGGGIAGLASQFGVDLGSLGAGTNSFFSGENIDDILTSTTVMEKVLTSRVDSVQAIGNTLADLYLDASGMRHSMAWKKLLTGFSFGQQPSGHAAERFRDSVLFAIMDRIVLKDLAVERSDKKGTIFQVQMKSANPLLARMLTERLVEYTSHMYVDIKTRNLSGNIKKLEARADSLKRAFQSKSFQSYQSQVLDANEAFSSTKATGEVSQRDKSVAFELYAEVAKNLEVSRMMLINQTPVIQVLDHPRQTMADSNMAAWKLLLLSALIGFFAGILLVAFSFEPRGR